jgi:hypothetical protein
MLTCIISEFSVQGRCLTSSYCRNIGCCLAMFAASLAQLFYDCARILFPPEISGKSDFFGARSLDDMWPLCCGQFSTRSLFVGPSLADGKCTGLRRPFPFPTRHGRNLTKGRLMSLHIPQYHPTKHTKKTTTAFLHSRQCCSTNPSSLSLPPLPWPAASPPSQTRALQG